jgi:hypothetical protein
MHSQGYLLLFMSFIDSKEKLLKGSSVGEINEYPFAKKNTY